MPRRPLENTLAEPAAADSRAETPLDLAAEVARLSGELDRVRAELDHNERLATLGTIAGLIAHEFNNLLTPVCSYAQMALDCPTDRAMATKALQRSLAGSEKAARIACAILGFVRDDSAAWGEKAAPSSTWNAPANSNISATLDDALLCLGRDLARDGIGSSRSMPADLAAAISPISLQHILMNVILNARRAMLPGGGSLAFKAYAAPRAPRPRVGDACSVESSTWNNNPSADADGRVRGDLDRTGCVVIEINDCGRGMTPEQLAGIFQPFFTSGPARTQNRSSHSSHDTVDRRGGTGLGMTVCTRLLQEVGGYMFIHSEAGRGTRVTIALPAASAANA